MFRYDATCEAYLYYTTHSVGPSCERYGRFVDDEGKHLIRHINAFIFNVDMFAEDLENYLSVRKLSYVVDQIRG